MGLLQSSPAATNNTNSYVNNITDSNVIDSSERNHNLDAMASKETTGDITTNPYDLTPEFTNQPVTELHSNNSSTSFSNFNPLVWINQDQLALWLYYLAPVAMVTGCILPYVPQYITIYKSRNSSGFSTYVCLTLLLANISRVFFWVGERFELPLLVQSAIMIVTQILLLELCVRVKQENSPLANAKKSYFSCNYKKFWAWDNIFSYIMFLVLFSSVLGVAMYFLRDQSWFVQGLGLASLLTESMLGLPQAIRNQRLKSVVGMSLGMVFMWLAGDLFKTAYFILRKNPYQFIICGIIQITIDILILFQVCIFRQRTPLKIDAHELRSPKEMITL